MPKPGLLVAISLVCAIVSIALLGSGRGSPAPPPADPVPGPAPPSASPILDLGEAGWLERSFTLKTAVPGIEPVEVVVELRASWRDGVGQVRVVGRDPDGAFDEVVSDEVRRGDDLAASLAHYQRMYDELRTSGGTVGVEGFVTVARQVIHTPDGTVDDVWRIGTGDPGW